MLPAVLHNSTGTYCLISEKNSITVTVLENNFPLNILYFLVVRMKIIRPMIIDANAAIVYHYAAICNVHSHYCYQI